MPRGGSVKGQRKDGLKGSEPLGGEHLFGSSFMPLSTGGCPPGAQGTLLFLPSLPAKAIDRSLRYPDEAEVLFAPDKESLLVRSKERGRMGSGGSLQAGTLGAGRHALGVGRLVLETLVGGGEGRRELGHPRLKAGLGPGRHPRGSERNR